MTAKKADSFGFAPPKRWTGLVRETSSDRWVQYPRLVPDKWRGNFQGERDAPMSGGLESVRELLEQGLRGITKARQSTLKKGESTDVQS